MTERSYQDAVQALKSHLGGRWDGLEAEGRDEMVRILTKELGYSNSAANDAIDAMVESGMLRYYTEGDDVAVAAIPAVPTATTGSGTPLPVPTALHAGYWQIGEGVVESIGRKGQVTPT
ncbi:MAG: hypothetical protein ACJ8CR_07500 [Roseiflexaceae bacterium]